MTLLQNLRTNKMAEQSVDEESKLKLNIKSTKRKDTVEVSPDCTVRQVLSIAASGTGQHILAPNSTVERTFVRTSRGCSCCSAVSHLCWKDS